MKAVLSAVTLLVGMAGTLYASCAEVKWWEGEAWHDGEAGNLYGAMAADAFGLPGAKERLDALVHDRPNAQWAQPLGHDPMFEPNNDLQIGVESSPQDTGGVMQGGFGGGGRGYLPAGLQQREHTAPKEPE
jgi:hypothetical protein